MLKTPFVNAYTMYINSAFVNILGLSKVGFIKKKKKKTKQWETLSEKGVNKSEMDYNLCSVGWHNTVKLITVSSHMDCFTESRPLFLQISRT